MNERIRELAEQAKAFIIESEHAKIGEVSEVSFDKYSDLEKFAKLIALECARLAMTQHYSTSPDDYDDMEPYEQGCDDTASNISGLIRRIFGVDE